MTQRDWAATDGRALGVFLNGAELRERDPRRRADRRRLVPAALQRPLRGRHVPAAEPARSVARWTLELSTAQPELEPASANYGAWTELTIPSHSILVLKRIA